MPGTETKPTSDQRTFTDQAARGNSGLVRELWDLIRHNKKWWLIPVIVVLLLIGVLVALGSTALAPFIYPLF
jgi:hypothetical protein